MLAVSRSAFSKGIPYMKDSLENEKILPINVVKNSPPLIKLKGELISSHGTTLIHLHITMLTLLARLL